MRCFSLLLGARDTGSADARILHRHDQLLRSFTARHSPAGSPCYSSGGWYDGKSRRLKAEESRQIIICGVSLSALRKWAADLPRALRQKELILIETGRSHAHLVSN